MALGCSDTLLDRFQTARSVLDDVLPRRRRVGRTYQGFIKALMARGDVLVPSIKTHLRAAIQTVAGRHWKRFGWVIFAVDGTKIDCVRSVANERSFGIAGKAKTKPQQLLTTLWHMGSGLPWAWVTGRADASERDQLRQMIDLLPTGAMLVADAGFTGFDLLWQLKRSGISFLVRVGANVHLLRELGCVVDQREDTVYLWPGTRRDHPPLALRLIRVQPEGRRQPVFLITNVLDDDRLSEETAAVIYRMRWGVEIFYRSLKQTLERRKMRSAAPTQAQLELQWTLIGLLLLGLLSVSGIVARDRDPLSCSVAGALRVVRRALARPVGSLRTLMRHLASATKDTYQRSSAKKARDWPHKKNDPPPGEPRIRTATAEEVRLAQRLTATETNL